MEKLFRKKTSFPAVCKYPVHSIMEIGGSDALSSAGAKLKIEALYDFKRDEHTNGKVDFEISLTVSGKPEHEYRYKKTIKDGEEKAVHRFNSREKHTHEIDLEADVNVDFSSSKIYLTNGRYHEDSKQYPINELVLFQLNS